VLYHGVLGARAEWRSLVVQFGAPVRPAAGAEPGEAAAPHAEAADCRHGRNYLWAELMRRSLGLDVLACPHCGGRLQLIALIDDPAVIRRILHHLGVSPETALGAPQRPCPRPDARGHDGIQVG
jgi:hypothetical protein